MREIFKGLKYPKEIEKALKIIYDTGIKEITFDEYLEEINTILPLSKLDNDLQAGVDNGYSAECQLEIIERLLKQF